MRVSAVVRKRSLPVEAKRLSYHRYGLLPVSCHHVLHDLDGADLGTGLRDKMNRYDFVLGLQVRVLSDELGAARISRAGGGSQSAVAETKGETALQAASNTRYNRRKTISKLT